MPFANQSSIVGRARLKAKISKLNLDKTIKPVVEFESGECYNVSLYLIDGRVARFGVNMGISIGSDLIGDTSYMIFNGGFNSIW